MTAIRFVIPMDSRSANAMLGRHRMALHKIAKQERSDTFKAAMGGGIRLWLKSNAAPFLVTFTRVIPPKIRRYDDDNLRLGLKHVRDEMARILGVNDSMRSPVEWHYEQERGSEAGVKVVIAGCSTLR